LINRGIRARVGRNADGLRVLGIGYPTP